MSELLQIQQDLSKFASDRDWNQYHTPSNLAKAISIEAAELLENFLWCDSSRNCEEEIADILIYAIIFCTNSGIDPLEAIRKKMSINSEKYPVSKAKGNCKKYSEL